MTGHTHDDWRCTSHVCGPPGHPDACGPTTERATHPCNEHYDGTCPTGGIELDWAAEGYPLEAAA